MKKKNKKKAKLLQDFGRLITTKAGFFHQRGKRKKNKKLITGASWNLSLLTKSFVTDHSRPTDGQFLFQMTRVITGLLLLVVLLL